MTRSEIQCKPSVTRVDINPLTDDKHCSSQLSLQIYLYSGLDTYPSYQSPRRAYCLLKRDASVRTAPTVLDMACLPKLVTRRLYPYPASTNVSTTSQINTNHTYVDKSMHFASVILFIKVLTMSFIHSRSLRKGLCSLKEQYAHGELNDLLFCKS